MQRRQFLRSALVGTTALLSGAGLTANGWLAPVPAIDPLERMAARLELTKEELNKLLTAIEKTAPNYRKGTNS